MPSGELGGGPPIPSGGTLPVTQTRGIVDLDTLLDSLTPRVRGAIQRVLRTGGYLVSNSTPADLRRLAAYLNPALSQIAELAAEVASNRYSLDRLVQNTAQVSAVLAAHSAQLGSAVTSTAATLRQIAGRRGALEDAVARAPPAC